MEHRFLVLLHVLGIGHGQTLHDYRQAGQGPQDPAHLGADQLGGVGVALLRHDRRAGREGIAELDKAKLRRDPQDDLFRQTRQVHRADARCRQGLQRKISGRDTVERIGRRPIKAQRLGGLESVDREGRACQGGSTQGAFIHPLARIDKA